jgi:8-oxo-dGTP diphosphatase
MRIPEGAWKIGKEILRHILRRPVVGICAVARTPDGRVVLVRRTDSGKWALPGGTLEWGETLRASVARELWEEAGVRVRALGELAGVYSDPARDPRFHAVTVVVHVAVGAPEARPDNALEIAEVALFNADALPAAGELSHGMADMLAGAFSAGTRWE